VLPALGRGAFTPSRMGRFHLCRTDGVPCPTNGLLFHANVGAAVGDGGVKRVQPRGRRLIGRPSPHSGHGLVLGSRRGSWRGCMASRRSTTATLTTLARNFPAMQAGFRYVFNDQVQTDGTFGSTSDRGGKPGGHAQTESWATVAYGS